MKILLTGATGYIGKRVLPVLVSKGFDVVCCVRDKSRFTPNEFLADKIDVIEIDLLKKDTLDRIPKDIDVAFYLVHSMSTSKDFDKLELESAKNFQNAISKTECKQVIYLSGIVNEDKLSDHLSSRLNVEKELARGKFYLTTLRAGIIVGSGSASFEIIRDLVEKLPVMVAPKWLQTKCQPIAVSDAITYLVGSVNNPKTFDKSFDIGGPDVLTYKEMLLEFAHVRKLKRSIFIVPVMTPKLSSYWLYFVTATSYKLASALVDSMKVEVVCQDNKIKDIIKTENLSYRQSLERAFKRIENHETISSWKDSFSSSELQLSLSDFAEVPEHGCFKDTRQQLVLDKEKVIENIWKLGGNNGWYFATWLWQLRGIIDKFFGGVGLLRGRSATNKISPGDSIDFWRVINANKETGKLLLFAEMKLPGEAWLEFQLKDGYLFQTATFRPHGVTGRLYWYSIMPFHKFLFQGMIKNIAKN
jgi:uncharacterized protein YbjT (DUF2867 family)